MERESQALGNTQLRLIISPHPTAQGNTHTRTLIIIIILQYKKV